MIAGILEQRYRVLWVIVVRADQLEARAGAAEIQTPVVFRIELRVVQVQACLGYAQRSFHVLFELLNVMAHHVGRPGEYELQESAVFHDEHLK